ncbi:MAG: response regulator [Janthinobacterium lividum]
MLVVDDEADLAALLLGHFGFDVSIAYSGTEALRRFERGERFDAVFSDVMMPGVTGLQLAAAVARLAPAVRVVLTSGYTVPTLLAGHAGKWACITKPYRIDAVVALLSDTRP